MHEMATGMRKLLCFAVEGAICIAIVLLYLSINQGKRPLELFSCASNNDKSIQMSNKMANNTSTAKFGFTNPAKEVSPNKLNGTIAEQQKKTPIEDILPLLQKAATDDRTVIITSVNEAWSAPNSLLDLFLENFRIGKNIEHLLRHLIIVALDPKAFERCKTVHNLCYQLKVDGVNFATEKVFMTKDYFELVWEKLNLQQQILEFGYNFLFTGSLDFMQRTDYRIKMHMVCALHEAKTGLLKSLPETWDVDILWFRNPFKQMTIYADITTSCDVFDGNPDSLRNSPNTGFFYVKSTKRTVEMLRYWREARNRFPPNHEQYVFNIIKQELASKLKVKIQFLDTFYFGGFCNHGNDFNKIRTMHANCCIHLDNKLHNLRYVAAVWKNYSSIPVKDKKRRKRFTWQAPGRCLY